MSAQVARSFAASGGRVLLAGDAAHRFPPAGGFGMNTGIQVGGMS
jgi:2-polyprenyl-6-methoxyphenol hydroxylase-like FAD-dependent oxidoreductase